jgi:plastocyanin
MTLLSGAFVGSAQAGGGGHCDTMKLSDRAASTIGMKNSCFTPTVTRVKAGGTVTWVNRDPFAHTLTAPGNWGSGYKEYLKGDSATFRFDDEGVFPYYCLLHAGMTGVVVVGDGLSSGALSNIEAVEPTQPLSETVDAREAAEVTESSSLSTVVLMTVVALALIALGGFAIARRRSAAPAALSR